MDVELSTNTYLSFMRKQVNLKHVTIVSKRTILMATLNALVSEFPNFPTLQECHLFLFKTFILWLPEWSTAFSESNIKILRIVSSGLLLVMPSAEVVLPRNTKLTTLAIRVKTSVSAEHIRMMLDSFPNLCDLSLSHVDNDALKRLVDVYQV